MDVLRKYLCVYNKICCYDRDGKRIKTKNILNLNNIVSLFVSLRCPCCAGVQESLVLCLREEDKKIVSPYLCSRNDQPEVLTQTCNDQPCPPRWNVSDFQPCSQSCGIGLQMREVNCIHEVTEGNTAIVPNNMCPQPPPTDRKQCNMIDCPTEWRTSEWSKVCAAFYGKPSVLSLCDTKNSTQKYTHGRCYLQPFTTFGMQKRGTCRF